MNETDKQAAAEAAVMEIVDGMLVGIGSGSTVAFATAAIGRRITALPKTRFFATSVGTRRAAAAAGVPIDNFSKVARLDLTIDGADEIDPLFHVIKGGGGAMLREKIVAAASSRMVVIADGSKRVKTLGGVPVPVEILPFAYRFVEAQLIELGAAPVLRTANGKAYRTDQGNLIIDCRFAGIPDPERLAARLQAIPGALGHGLFLDEVDAAYFSTNGVVTKMERNAA